MHTYWISYRHKMGSYVTILVTVVNTKVIAAAPIARWTIGKDWDYVYRYYQRQCDIIIQLLPFD